MRVGTRLAIGTGLLLLGLGLGFHQLAADESPQGKGPTSSLFDRYAQGQPTWQRSAITDSRILAQFDRIASRLGITDGQITRDQYDAYLADRRAERSRGISLTPASVSANDNEGSASAATTIDHWAEALFHRHDRNGDGLLSFEEMPEALRAERTRWDANGDGFIDLAEFKRYFQSRRQQVLRDAGREEAVAAMIAPRREAGSVEKASLTSEALLSTASPLSAGLPFSGSSPPPLDPPLLNPVEPEDETTLRPRREEEERDEGKFAYRAGKLPANLPAWFQELDRDGDGQVSLYEWRISGRSIAEFQRMDRNGDGFLTAEEVRFYEKHVIVAAKAPRASR